MNLARSMYVCVYDFGCVSNSILTDSLFRLNDRVGCRFTIHSIRMVLEFLLQLLLLILDFFGVSHDVAMIIRTQSIYHE